jgi:hypothetical protein
MPRNEQPLPGFRQDEWDSALADGQVVFVETPASANRRFLRRLALMGRLMKSRLSVRVVSSSERVDGSAIRPEEISKRGHRSDG